MKDITTTFVVYPTRIANVVHYLTHGRTISPIKVNPDEFDRLVQWIQQSLSKESKQPSRGFKNTSNLGAIDTAFYEEQASVLQKNIKQGWRAK